MRPTDFNLMLSLAVVVYAPIILDFLERILEISLSRRGARRGSRSYPTQYAGSKFAAYAVVLDAAGFALAQVLGRAPTPLASPLVIGLLAVIHLQAYVFARILERSLIDAWPSRPTEVPGKEERYDLNRRFKLQLASMLIGTLSLFSNAFVLVLYFLARAKGWG